AVTLLRPEHPDERLPLYAPLVLARLRRINFRVELVGLAPPRLHDVVNVAERLVKQFVTQTQADDDRAARRDVQRRVMKASLRPRRLRVDCVVTAFDDVLVECVLDERLAARGGRP